MDAAASTVWRSLAGGRPRDPLPRGLDAAWHFAAGFARSLVARPRRYLRRAAGIDRLQHALAELTDAALRERLLQLRERFRLGRHSPADVDAALAGVCETGLRTLGFRPHVEQMAAALALLDGCVAEQATGEGKTFTAVMSATVLGWQGRGCHVVTTNDYLAQRDAEWMTDVYARCGARVSFVVGEMDPADRRQAYQADVTYLTNKEVAADFLRDRLTLGRGGDLPNVLLGQLAGQGMGGSDRLVQRGLVYAIVDEADSILIDEAVTPLILSGSAPNDEQVQAFQQAAQLAADLESGGDYRVNERYREVELTPRGRDKLLAGARPLGGVWAGQRRGEELVTQALTARHLYRRDGQYVVQEGKVVIVDEFTGRLMPDREWRDGLHQAVQAKEGLDVEPPKDTFARISFQRFFRLYRRLAGMTGTAAEARREFWQTYRMPVVVFPTHHPCRRHELADRVFASRDAKWAAAVEAIAGLHDAGSAVLVGTRSVGDSEHLSGLLTQRNLPHEVLNAVRHEEEARIVAQAGQPGTITVATNMAGRGTDIRLGRGVTETGGLHVIATERHESRRVDRQLFGRSGRQGDPGWAQAFVSLEDELVVRHTPRRSKLLRRRHGRADGPIRSRLARRLFDRAQRRAQRLAARQRAAVLRTDDWLDEQLGFAGREH